MRVPVMWLLPYQVKSIVPPEATIEVLIVFVAFTR
jgi:hypothetical protein